MTLEKMLLISAAALCVTALALLASLLMHAKRERIQERLPDVARRVVDEKLRAAGFLTSGDLKPLANGIEQLRGELAALSRSVETFVAAPSGDPVALEHQILGESWKQFQKNAELSAALDDTLENRAWTQLLDQLTSVVPTDLKPTFDAVIVPCREQRSLLQRIELIPRIVNGDFSRLGTSAEEIRRTRELASLLTSELTKVLDFRFKNWVTDSFLPFADLYLQRYQQAQLEKRDAELSQGLSLVRQVLRVAAVEPIDVTPGETLFDSTRHVGRSTSNDPRFSDGVITGVVRNGFIEEGQQVIRQPEVIVNRMR
jgi:molecular chaperone GrpE (heat shock protein)